jgi:hypothetical protein
MHQNIRSHLRCMDHAYMHASKHSTYTYSTRCDVCPCLSANTEAISPCNDHWSNSALSTPTTNFGAKFPWKIIGGGRWTGGLCILYVDMCWRTIDDVTVEVLVCMYVCKYVYTYVCMYVYVCMYTRIVYFVRGHMLADD